MFLAFLLQSSELRETLKFELTFKVIFCWNRKKKNSDEFATFLITFLLINWVVNVIASIVLNWFYALQFNSGQMSFVLDINLGLNFLLMSSSMILMTLLMTFLMTFLMTLLMTLLITLLMPLLMTLLMTVIVLIDIKILIFYMGQK